MHIVDKISILIYNKSCRYEVIEDGCQLRKEVVLMKQKVQVKGTLPLVADFLNESEKRIYDVFSLDVEKKKEKNKNTKGETTDEIADKS